MIQWIWLKQIKIPQATYSSNKSIRTMWSRFLPILNQLKKTKAPKPRKWMIMCTPSTTRKNSGGISKRTMMTLTSLKKRRRSKKRRIKNLSKLYFSRHLGCPNRNLLLISWKKSRNEMPSTSFVLIARSRLLLILLSTWGFLFAKVAHNCTRTWREDKIPNATLKK